MRPTVLVVLFIWPLCLSLNAIAQTPQWLHTAGGGSGNDQVRVCKIAQNGNLCIAGKFSGTVDLDPSPSTFNIISNGLEDLYVAVYTQGGSFLWGFGTGGVDNDMVYDLVTDDNSNIYITGYFKGANVDFDPSVSTALLSDNGLAPGTPAVGGDGFIAKYTSSGQYLWCHNIGGTGTTDLGESLCLDKAGNVYLGGIFSGAMDIDPSPNVVNLNTANGISYVIKYTPAGQLIWGKTIGANSVWAIKMDSAGYLYITGAYDGINSDFDPSPTGTTYLTATGIYDAYLAKYDTAFNLQFAKGHGGNDLDECYNMDLDAAGNIYLSGSTLSSSMMFGSISALAPGVAENMYMVKYDNKGQALWGYAFGGAKNDKARAYIKDSFVYVTGYFSSTIDFDPSPLVANLVSYGEQDIFLCTYDLDGNYICGFNMGGSGNDQGVALAFDQQNNFYFGGDFATIVDFDPTANNITRSSNGGRDLYFGKYYLPSAAPLPNGFLIGDTVCLGEQAFLQFIATSGLGPFDITYTDGEHTTTRYNVRSGDIFALDPNPLHTTTYTLLTIIHPDICNKAVNHLNKTAIVLVSKPEVSIAKSGDVDCKHASIKLTAGGAKTYRWMPETSMLDSGSSCIVVPAVNTTYTVVGINELGCKDTTSIDVQVNFNDGGNIFFPQAFTPNNDGLNDCFRIRSGSTFSRYELSVYNRWGERVFYTVDANDCWNGTYKGLQQPLGTFYYYCNAITDQCGEFSGKGDVHLIR